MDQSKFVETVVFRYVTDPPFTQKVDKVLQIMEDDKKRGCGMSLSPDEESIIRISAGLTLLVLEE